MNLALMPLLAAALLSWNAAVITAGSAAGRANQPARSGSEILDDSVVTTRVKSALLAEKGVDSLDIDVRTYLGNVQLFGLVDSRWQVDKAAQVAAAVDGVRHVTNDLVHHPQ
jgi:osmotically-inducible protein OsmY